MEPPNPVAILPSLEVIQSQLDQEIIRHLLDRLKTIPTGERRDRLLDETKGNISPA